MQFQENPAKYTLTLAEYFANYGNKGTTKYRNDTRETIRMTFGADPLPHTFVKDEYDAVTGEVFKRGKQVPVHAEVVVEIPAGEEIELPKEWDRAIHTVHHGIIIGGLAPNLTRVDRNLPVDVALLPSVGRVSARVVMPGKEAIDD